MQESAVPSSTAGPGGSKRTRPSGNSSDDSELKSRAFTPGGSRTRSHLPPPSTGGDSQRVTSKRRVTPSPSPTPFAQAFANAAQPSEDVPSLPRPCQRDVDEKTARAAQPSEKNGLLPTAGQPVDAQTANADAKISHSDERMADAAGCTPDQNGSSKGHGSGSQPGEAAGAAGQAGLHADMAGPSMAGTQSQGTEDGRANNPAADSEPHAAKAKQAGDRSTSQKRGPSQQEAGTSKRQRQAGPPLPAGTPTKQSFRSRLVQSPLGKWLTMSPKPQPTESDKDPAASPAPHPHAASPVSRLVLGEGATPSGKTPSGDAEHPCEQGIGEWKLLPEQPRSKRLRQESKSEEPMDGQPDAYHEKHDAAHEPMGSPEGSSRQHQQQQAAPIDRHESSQQLERHERVGLHSQTAPAHNRSENQVSVEQEHSSVPGSLQAILNVPGPRSGLPKAPEASLTISRGWPPRLLPR